MSIRAYLDPITQEQRSRNDGRLTVSFVVHRAFLLVLFIYLSIR